MKKTLTLAIAAASMLAALTFVSRVAADGDDHHHSGRFEFKAGTLVLSRSVYAGTHRPFRWDRPCPQAAWQARSRYRSCGRHDDCEGHMRHGNRRRNVSDRL